MKLPTTTRRSFLGGSALAASTLLAACGGGTSGGTGTATTDGGSDFAGTINLSEDLHIQGYDWGAGVDKVVLTPDYPIDAISAEDLVVTEHKQATDWTAEDFPVIEADFERKVTSATLNEDGTITLELYCSPNDGSPFLYTMATGYNTWCEPYQLNIALAEGAALTSNGTPVTEIVAAEGSRTNSAEEAGWILGGSDHQLADGTTMSFNYASWEQPDSKNLVVWLHGAGEGGTEATDPYVTVLANKVVALSSDEFQQTVGGASVVAPQCPTIWMDIDGTHTYISAENSTEVKSYYTEALESFIDTQATLVGAEKIVLAGCSNGGFMTLWMCLHRPDKYAGLVPICEAIPDALISDEQIAGVKDVPMYFVYSKDDTTVIPSEHEEPTIERLKAAGASNLHVSTSDSVIDTSGEYTNEDGTPYTYNGHWSWIYFDNNECACVDDGLKAWDFIKECFA